MINHDSDDYIKSPKEWQPIEGSLEAIAQLNHAGYRIVVATNQSGIARQLFSIDALVDMHNKMLRLAEEAGGHIEAIFFCPHAPHDDCSCRKPKPGMYLSIGERFKVPLENLPVVGDSLHDLKPAIAVNAQPYLVKTGKGNQSIGLLEESDLGNIPIFDDLSQVANHIITNLR